MYHKIVLVKPPERSEFNFGTFSLGVLAAALPETAHVAILDATGLSPANAAVQTWACEPDLIGVTVMGVASVGPAEVFIRHLAQADSRHDAPIIAGGHGASNLPGRLLEAGARAVVIGEGETTFRRIVDHGLEPGAPGLACLADGRMVTGPMPTPIAPLDRLRPPARDLMPPPPNGIHLIETSRGCPHACAFCETTRFHGRRWRACSPAWVAAEVRRLVDRHDAYIIHIADDNFAASTRRVKRICGALREHTLPVFFMASARADDLVADPDLLPAMAAARILRINVGVESLDPSTARAAGKPIPLATYAHAFRRMRDLGMFSVASLIIGLPGESPAARDHILELTLEAAPDSAHFLPFLPIPGVPMAEGCERRDWDPSDARYAASLNEAFCHHPDVVVRLEAAANHDDVRGLLARATLERHGGNAAPPTA